jgi:hypothetical protein
LAASFNFHRAGRGFPDDFNALFLMVLEGCGYWPQSEQF